MAESHAALLPGTDWEVWRWALLRSAGFPAQGLDRFSMPECASAADAYLAEPAGDGFGQAGNFQAAFDDAITATANKDKIPPDPQP